MCEISSLRPAFGKVSGLTDSSLTLRMTLVEGGLQNVREVFFLYIEPSGASLLPIKIKDILLLLKREGFMKVILSLRNIQIKLLY